MFAQETVAIRARKLMSYVEIKVGNVFYKVFLPTMLDIFARVYAEGDQATATAKAEKVRETHMWLIVC